MKTGASLKNRQGGAVAVMVGISIVLLVGFLAMVIDLGRLYLAKTGLQNAADAAALAGALELDGTGAGICCDDGTGGSVRSAVYMATHTAGLNTFFGNLGQETVDIGAAVNTNPNIRFSRSPDGPENEGGKWGVSIATAVENPADKYFIRVDTASGNLQALFAPVWAAIGGGISTMGTGGLAVAGSYLQDIAPLAVCAIDEDDNDNYGYIKGVGYNISEINRILEGLSSGDQYWLHPTATKGKDDPDSDCNANYASTDAFRSYLCQGKSAITLGGNIVISNTGSGGESHNKAVNTRFGWEAKYYDNNLTAQLCAPDLNVMQFGASGFWGNNPPANTKVADWLITGAGGSPYTPTFDKNYDLTLDPNNCLSPGSDTKKVEFGQGTPLAMHAICPNNIYVGATRNPALEASVLGSYVKPAETDLAKKLKSTYATTAYFAGLDPSSDYHYPPYTTGTTPQPNRRIINMVIVNCRGDDPGACAEIPKLAVAQFFLPVEAGIPQKLYAEYVRRIISAKDLKPEVRLYQ